MDDLSLLLPISTYYALYAFPSIIYNIAGTPHPITNVMIHHIINLTLPDWRQLQPYVFAAGLLAVLLLLSLVALLYLRHRLNQRTNALRHSESRYRTLVENATEGILVIAGAEGRIVFANPMAAEILGQPLVTLEGLSVANLIHPEDREPVMARYSARLQGENPPPRYILRVITARGATRWLLLHAERINWEDQPAVLVMFSDITERQEAEFYVNEKLRQMAALRAIDTAIINHTEMTTVLTTILREARTAIPMDAAALWLLDPEEQHLNLVVAEGFQHLQPQFRRSLSQDPWAREVITTRRAFQHLKLDVHALPSEIQNLFQMEDFQAYLAAPLVAHGEIYGLFELFYRSPLENPPDWLSFFENLSTQTAVAVEHVRWFQALQDANRRLTQAYEATIEGWAAALELRDGSLSGHSRRVAEWSVSLAKALGLEGETLSHIWYGALLHDIGKMGIPDAILQKEDDLTPEEWDLMKRHPEYALRFLEGVEFLRPALDIPYYHHERWDGSGYPKGLREEQIPLAARIFAVVDV
ncbi:HD domain-containing phosphohydrolase, partial [Thermanaerothrix sp.]|uniref:HD domain-containing phosphohydrolase n=1 Tax=Thermanaerothrix sp. TaxID=2972675 RepID=UPI003C7ADEF2